MDTPLKEEEFLKHLRTTIKFLIVFSELYDKGFEEISMHIALEIRKLVHDTNSSTSLLEHLDKKDIDFFDTSIEGLGDQELSLPLLKNSSHIPSVFSISEQSPLPTIIFEHYEPLLDQSHSLAKKVSFESWWDKKEVIRIKDVTNITRRDLIMGIANQDGGAHVDGEVEQNIYDLARMPQKSGEIKNGLLRYYLNSVAYPTVRQIAHEVLMTLYAEYPDYFSNSNPYKLAS